jgi:hypothetical protein
MRLGFRTLLSLQKSVGGFWGFLNWIVNQPYSELRDLLKKINQAMYFLLMIEN